MTVSCICEESGISRVTFYKYYKDLDDVLIQIQDDFISSFKKKILSTTYIKNNDSKYLLKQLEDYDQENHEQFVLRLREETTEFTIYLNSHRELFQAIRKTDYNKYFIRKIKECYFKELMKSVPLELLFKYSKKMIENFFSVFGNGLFQKYQDWLYDPDPISIEQMIDSLTEIYAINLKLL